MANIADENYLFWNQGKSPLVGYNFMLRVELMFDLPCKSIRAFTREMEYEYIQEGGLNDYVHMLRKPISQPFTLEVERYVGVDYVDPLPLGGALKLPLLLFVGREPNQFIPLLVARTYAFTGCCITKKTYGDLVGDRSELLVETTTIAYQEMVVVDIPWSTVKTDVGTQAPPPPVTNSLAELSTLKEWKKDSASITEKAKQDWENAQVYEKECDTLMVSPDKENYFKEQKAILDDCIESMKNGTEKVQADGSQTPSEGGLDRILETNAQIQSLQQGDVKDVRTGKHILSNPPQGQMRQWQKAMNTALVSIRNRIDEKRHASMEFEETLENGTD